MSKPLEDLLKRCIVKVKVPNGIGWGTGFFVAPGQLLTCAHVINDTLQQVEIVWQQQSYLTNVEWIQQEPHQADLALLKLENFIPDHPCVYLDGSIQADDRLYTFGYSDDFADGAPVTGLCEGLTGDHPALLKFKAGQVRPGLSGSPLLNQRTGKVCGVVKFTRDRSLDLGGGAIPASVIGAQLLNLFQQNQWYHQGDRSWTKLLPNSASATHLTPQEDKNRRMLLNKVNNQWIKGVLEKSLHELITLELEERPEAIPSPWGLEFVTADRPKISCPEGTQIIDLFDSIGDGRTLLILGDSGSGKTTTLLHLARALVSRATDDPSHLIPVVLNLSSWKDVTQTIHSWLINELNSKYQVPLKVGQGWVEEQKLLLLLDGLDEVKAGNRNDCVFALNSFQQEFCTEIIVCSRVKDYENLEVNFNCQNAVYLKNLTLKQIQSYLNDLVSKGLDLAGLKQLLETDTALKRLARSPLLLNIMVLTYQGIPMENVRNVGEVKNRQKQLFDDYIERMLEWSRLVAYTQKISSRILARQEYSRKQVIEYLAELAQQMLQEPQVFFTVDQMQVFWIRSKFLKELHHFLSILICGISGFLLGCFLSLPIGVIDNQIQAYEQAYKQTMEKESWQSTSQFLDELRKRGYHIIDGNGVFSLSNYPEINGFAIISSWILTGATIGLLLGLVFGLFLGRNKNIITVEKLKFNRPVVNASTAAGIIGLIISFVAAVAFQLFGILSGDTTLAHSALLFPTIISIVLVIPSFRSWLVVSESQEKRYPNQGIRLSAINATTVAMVGGVLGAFVTGGLSNSSEILVYRLLVGLFLGIIAGLEYGGRTCIQHFVLRLFLYCEHRTPWNYTRFLNWATDRVFLQKVGGGYIFIHRMLMEHFVQMPVR